MTLSVIIPVRDEPVGLTRLLLQLRDMRIADQVIISDDGSDIPCSPALVADVSRQLGDALPLSATDPLPGIDLVWLRSEVSQGAGHARNIAADHATTSHVLFFDADDALAPDLNDILRALEGRAYDFAMFRHHDTRILAKGGTGPLEPDASYWRAIGAADGIRLLSHADALTLCRVSAYPWNKIWRRDFLMTQDIRCTEIPIHNDIEPHWAGFLAADRVLVTGRIGCIHHVATGRNQLTNRRDTDRLRVFEALGAVIDRLGAAIARDPGQAHFADPFLDFALRLFDWVRGRLDGATALHDFYQKQNQFLRSLAAPHRGAQVCAAFELALLRNPDLARRAAPVLERAA